MLALIARVKELEAELETGPTSCSINESAPGLQWCKTHDSMWVTGGECDLKNQTVPPERIARREQRGRNVLERAEARAEAAEAKIAAVRELHAASPCEPDCCLLETCNECLNTYPCPTIAALDGTA